MTNKLYRTAQGKQLDMGALILKNEHVRAVGNMSVNARGDVIDSWDQPIDPKTQQSRRQHNQTSKLSNAPVASAAPAAVPTAAAPGKVKKPKVKPEIPPTPEDFDDEFDKSITGDTAASGLAGAIARARELRSATAPETTVKKI